MTTLTHLCSAPVNGAGMCARPAGHDDGHDPRFNTDEWPEPDTNTTNGTQT